MRIKNSIYNEFEVWCRKCKKVIIVEGPEDLQKEIKDEEEIFCLICPECGHEICFDGVFGHMLSTEFKKQVKMKKRDFLGNVLEAGKKFNEEFEGTFDKI